MVTAIAAQVSETGYAETGLRIPKGYKQTEVGVIPVDWDASKLATLGDVIRGASPRPKGDKRFYGGNIPRLMVEDVTRDGKIVVPQIDFLTEEGSKRSRPCKKGTLTIVCSGTVGIPSFLGVDACIHDGFLALVGIRKNVNDDYLYHQLCRLRESFDSSATHGGIFTNLTTSGVKEFIVPLPPTKAEQETIAEALSTADALIDSLAQLITKKRHLKQGVMQELLTGKKRLPGFSGEWKEKRLGSTAILKARIGWQGLTTAEYLDSGDYYLVTGTEFKDGYIDWNRCHYVDEYRYKQDKNIQLKEHDVVVTKDGTIGKIALIPSLPRPATLNSGVFVIRPIDEAFHPEFFYYLLCSSTFTQFLTQLSAGSTINHLYQKDFVDFVYKTPETIKEQTAIANILNDMGAEITLLEDKLAKARQIKQGMMQELLTGRTRLI